MEMSRKLAVTALAAVILIVSHSHPVAARTGETSEMPTLSAHWRPVVTRWESIVVQYSERHSIDPDLVASVVWKESRGIHTAVGPTGAVGLMCIKPFPWRTTAEQLLNPSTNVAWGTAILAHVIRDGKGDVYHALAAYNGGWDKIQQENTRRYAADVLGEYVSAVAVRKGYAPDGNWFAVIGVDGLPGRRTLTVLGPHQPLARHTERPLANHALWFSANGPADTTVMTFSDPAGREVQVNLWIVPWGSL